MVQWAYMSMSSLLRQRSMVRIPVIPFIFVAVTAMMYPIGNHSYFSFFWSYVFFHFRFFVDFLVLRFSIYSVLWIRFTDPVRLKVLVLLPQK